MRLLLNDYVYGWRMSGLLGKDGAWFLGYSRRPDSSRVTPEHIQQANARLMRRSTAGVAIPEGGNDGR
jgi:hypothetical protein